MLNKSLSDSWSFFKNHAIALCFIILPFVAPVQLFSALYQHFFASEEVALAEQLIPMSIAFAAYPIYSVAVVFYLASRISGESVNTKSLWSAGLKYWMPYAVVSLFVGAAVVFGLMAFIIPGIYLAVRFAFSEFELLLNKVMPTEAMKSSWDKTREHTLVIFGGYAIITLILYAPYYLFAPLFAEPTLGLRLLNAVVNMVYTVLGSLYTIFAFRVFTLDRTPSP